MALVKVKVEGTWIVAKRSMDQLSGNLWLGIIGFIVFIFFSILFGRLQCVYKDIDFKEVFYVGQFFQFYTTELLFLRKKLSISLIVMLCIPL